MLEYPWESSKSLGACAPVSRISTGAEGARRRQDDSGAPIDDYPISCETGVARLSYRVDAQGYFIILRTSNAKVPPNTPCALSPAGFGGARSIAGGNLVQRANYDYVSPDGQTSAPTVSMARFLQPSWVSRHNAQGIYRGLDLARLRALVLSALAGDGDHTLVEFHMNGVPYGVGDYHDINQAVEMAASMTVMPKQQVPPIGKSAIQHRFNASRS